MINVLNFCGDPPSTKGGARGLCPRRTTFLSRRAASALVPLALPLSLFQHLLALPCPIRTRVLSCPQGGVRQAGATTLGRAGQPGLPYSLVTGWTVVWNTEPPKLSVSPLVCARSPMCEEYYRAPAPLAGQAPQPGALPPKVRPGQRPSATPRG